MPKIGVAGARREQVMRAALQCLIRDGYCNVSVKAIAREAGVSTGILYHYFRNKDDIVVQSLATAFAATDKNLRQTVDAAPSGPERLRSYLELAALVGQQDSTTVAVLLNALGQASYSATISERLARLLGSFRQYAASTLQDTFATNGGELPPERRDALAALVVAIGLGLSIQWAVQPGAISPEACSKALQLLVENTSKAGGSYCTIFC